MLSIGSARGDFRSPRLRLKTQPIEPLHKISLEFPLFQYFAIIFKIVTIE
jgi:hypothetical protein